MPGRNANARPPSPRHERLRQARGGGCDWRRFSPASPNVGAARRARTTARTATPAPTYRTTTPAAAHRLGEDRLAGSGDDRRLPCLSLDLWNTGDPILEEGLFGPTGPEGNHERRRQGGLPLLLRRHALARLPAHGVRAPAGALIRSYRRNSCGGCCSDSGRCWRPDRQNLAGRVEVDATYYGGHQPGPRGGRAGRARKSARSCRACIASHRCSSVGRWARTWARSAMIIVRRTPTSSRSAPTGARPPAGGCRSTACSSWPWGTHRSGTATWWPTPGPAACSGGHQLHAADRPRLRRPTLAGRRPASPGPSAQAASRPRPRVDPRRQGRRPHRCRTPASTPGTPLGTRRSIASTSPGSTWRSPSTRRC